MNKLSFLDSIFIPSFEEQRIKSYGFGKDWADTAILAAKARIYLEQNLNEVLVSASTPYRCYNEGTLRFSRKDGGKVTENDCYAILAIPRGQGNSITHRDDFTVTVKYFCDSSD
jgi:hypothetical protein